MGSVALAQLGEDTLYVALDHFFRYGKIARHQFVGFPGAINRSTSISREVNESSAECAASWAATSGGIRLCPLWTARMVSSSSRRNILFNRYAWAPALRARRICASPVYVVRTTIRASGNSRQCRSSPGNRGNGGAAKFRGLQFDDSALQSKRNGVGPIIGAKFRENTLNVGLYRFFGN